MYNAQCNSKKQLLDTKKRKEAGTHQKMGEYKQRQGEHFSHQTIINTLDVDDCILYFFGLCI